MRDNEKAFTGEPTPQNQFLRIDLSFLDPVETEALATSLRTSARVVSKSLRFRQVGDFLAELASELDKLAVVKRQLETVKLPRFGPEPVTNYRTVDTPKRK